MGCRNVLKTIVLLLIFSNLKGQDKKLFSGKFEGYTFDEFARQIEAVTQYRFYFDPAEADTIPFNIQADNIPLTRILDKYLEGTGLFYSIDSLGRVFVSKHFQIQTKLPDNFFRRKNNFSSDTSGIFFAADEPEAGKDKLKVSVENKVFEIGNRAAGTGKNSVTIAGYVREIKTGEAIAGASVYIDSLSIGATTDQYGYYTLTVRPGQHLVKISSTGMKDARRHVIVNADGKLDIEMQEYVASLKAVIVSAEKTANTKGLQMGVNKLSIRTIKQVPVVFGEADVLKVVLTLPGVTSAGEAANGFNVRGGSTDQNLILLNDATIYNPSHLFGFFSAFNPDVVKGLELYKSAIPEKYGGRLSSVLDVTMQDGNSKKWSGIAGIGPLTSKFTIEGPVKKDKTSIIAGVRTTYSNWLLGVIPNNAYKNSKADFYDANLHISHIFNAKNSLFLTGYLSNDRFNLNNDTTYKYGNRNAYIKWKHIFNNKFFNTTTAGGDYYKYSVKSSSNPVNAYNLGFDISQFTFRSDFVYSSGDNKHIIDFGLTSVYYKLKPGSFEPVGDKSLVVKNVLPSEQGLESAVYAGDKYSITPDLSLSAGIRFSVFNYLGPHDVYNYANGLPRDTTTIVDTSRYNSGKIIKTYMAPEIRIGLRYALSGDASIKLSFNTLQQYIHMLSNTVTISPTDIWKLSDPNIKPQQGQQVSLGFYKNFKSNMYETSIEVYYKKLKDYMDYKSGAALLLNHHIETDVVNTKGKAYGVELLIKKVSGRLNGWLSYAYSRTFLKLDDPIAGQTINKGNYYPASFDKPHNVNLIGNYRFSHRYSLSINVVYSTGRPITLPIAIFNQGGSYSLLYSDRNQYRIPDYFRSDISFTMEGNHKIKQKTHNSWSFGAYNLTARQNAYSVYFTEENGKIKGYQLSIFGTIIPFITYNIKF